MGQSLFLGVAVFAALFRSFASADSEESIARELAEIKKNFETKHKDLKKELAAATDADERKRVLFSIKETSALSAGDAVELAHANPKTEAGLDSALFAVKLLGDVKLTNQDWDKAIRVILENHADNLKIMAALGPIGSSGSSGLRFLKDLVEKTTKKEIQGLASYYVARDLAAQYSEHDREGANVSAEKLRGMTIEMMEKAAKLAPDVKVGNETLTKVVERELISLSIAIDKAVPDVEGIDLDGKKVKLSSFKGKVVLLDFWATWCGPCVKMIPHEREMVEKLAKKGFVLLSVNFDEEKSTLTEFMTTQKMPWTHWWDGQEGPVGKMFRVSVFPSLYLIDAKGVLRKKWFGSPGDEKLDKAIEEVIGKTEKGK
jgi:thiol-disulfide isomerase/thioredoxin